MTYRPIPLDEFVASLPEDEREAIRNAAVERLRDYDLRQVRAAIRKTQKEVAAASGMSQGEISRLERRGGAAQVMTLQRYIRALGGELKLVARFPSGEAMEIGLRDGRPVASRIASSK